MRFVAIVAVLMLAGCVSSSLEPSQADLKAQWEARNIPPLDYKSDIIALMRTYLNDPNGVRSAGVSPPQRKTVIGEPDERFITCVRFDARKTSGDYAGVKTGAAVYVSGKLDRFLDTPRVVEALCKDAAYQPFPELERLRR
ncbi:MAG: hypothetical protein ACR2K5_14555 [Pseudolabrys sp.]